LIDRVAVITYGLDSSRFDLPCSRATAPAFPDATPAHGHLSLIYRSAKTDNSLLWSRQRQNPRVPSAVRKVPEDSAVFRFLTGNKKPQSRPPRRLPAKLTESLGAEPSGQTTESLRADAPRLRYRATTGRPRWTPARRRLSDVDQTGVSIRSPRQRAPRVAECAPRPRQSCEGSSR
jgi:hypothetical protein